MNIVKWLRGLQEKLLNLVVFSVGNLGTEYKEKLHFNPKALETC